MSTHPSTRDVGRTGRNVGRRLRLLATLAVADASSFFQATSGTCATPVTSAADCETAAAALGLSDTTAQASTLIYATMPPYCVVWQGGLLLLSESNPGCCSTEHICICQHAPPSAPPAPPSLPLPPHPPPLPSGWTAVAEPYYLLTAGSCSVPIMSQPICEAAAAALGLGDAQTAGAGTTNSLLPRPPGCVWLGGSESLVLYGAGNTAACDASASCICEWGGLRPPIPPPSPLPPSPPSPLPPSPPLLPSPLPLSPPSPRPPAPLSPAPRPPAVPPTIPMETWAHVLGVTALILVLVCTCCVGGLVSERLIVAQRKQPPEYAFSSVTTTGTSGGSMGGSSSPASVSVAAGDSSAGDVFVVASRLPPPEEAGQTDLAVTAAAAQTRPPPPEAMEQEGLEMNESVQTRLPPPAAVQTCAGSNSGSRAIVDAATSSSYLAPASSRTRVEPRPRARPSDPAAAPSAAVAPTAAAQRELEVER